jgi:NAD(P)H-hydrate epimerase
MILGLLAQGYSPVHSALIGVYLHGAAADLAVENQSYESMLASDIIECIGGSFKKTIPRSVSNCL